MTLLTFSLHSKEDLVSSLLSTSVTKFIQFLDCSHEEVQRSSNTSKAWQTPTRQADISTKCLKILVTWCHKRMKQQGIENCRISEKGPTTRQSSHYQTDKHMGASNKDDIQVWEDYQRKPEYIVSSSIFIHVAI